MVLSYILAATVLDGLLGLIGIFSLYIRQETLKKLTKLLVAFAAGTMLAGALLHMLPKAMSSLKFAPELFVIGFLAFFVLERGLRWHHCHKLGRCEVHPMSYLTIVGDAIHNFVDGLVIAATFLTSIPLGIITTVMIVAHELPQELGNFSVLIYSGMPKIKAILWTFLSQLTCILGGLVGYFFLPTGLIPWLIAFAGGGFLYIAASDLIPELHETPDTKETFASFVLLVLGILFLETVKIIAKGG